MPGYRRRPTPRSHPKRVPLYGRCNHRPILGKSRSSISRRRGSPVGLFGPRCVHYISQITPKFREIVPPFHRQENCIPSAALRQPDFGGLAVFGSPFGPVFHHPDTPLLGLDVYPWNVRLWLEADIHLHPELRPLYPRKRTFRKRLQYAR